MTIVKTGIVRQGIVTQGIVSLGIFGEGGEVQPPIASGTFAPDAGVVGTAYSYPCAPLFTGGAVDTYSVEAGVLPDGLSLNTITGDIEGQPTTEEIALGISIGGTNAGGTATTNTADITITAEVVATDLVLNLDGTNYGSLSEPKTIVGAGSVTFNATTTGGVLQDLTDGYSITALDVFNTPAEVTDILVDGLSVGLGGPAPVDGLNHIIKFIFSSMSVKNNVGANNLGNNNFAGIIHDALFTDDTTPANSISWLLNSGPPVYDVGEEVIDGIKTETIGTNWTGDFSTTLHATNAGYTFSKIDDGILAGKQYVIEFTIENLTSGNFRSTEGSSDVLPSLLNGSYRYVATKASSTDDLGFKAGSSNTTGDITNISIKPYISTISDGTVYEPSEEHGTLPDIMRPDEWINTDANKVGTGKSVSFNGLQGAWSTVSANNGDLYSGLHVFVVNVTVTTGSVYVHCAPDGEGRLFTASDVLTFSQVSDANAITVEDDGANATRFSGTVEIIQTNPVPQGLEYFGVEDADWMEVGTNVLTMIMRTTTPTETITIPATGANSFNIDWGDGNSEGVNTINPSHVYDVADDYTIVITGTCPALYFNNGVDSDKLLSVVELGNMGWSTFGSSFYGCSNLVEFNSVFADISSVTSMYAMMRGWSSMITPPNLSSFDTSSATNMASMMRGWSSMITPPDLSSFDTSSATNMFDMMRDWSAMGEIDISIDTFSIPLVTNMSSMLLNTSLTTACYDRTLISWAAQSHQPNVTAHFGNSTYTLGGAAEAARDVLVADGWIITDLGGV